jgi:hypothetical protein
MSKHVWSHVRRSELFPKVYMVFQFEMAVVNELLFNYLSGEKLTICRALKVD